MLLKDDIRSLTILRALQLGDLLCAVPAFRALRGAFPGAHISIIGLAWMKMFVERFSMYLNEFILFPGYPGLPEQPVHPEATTGFLCDMVKRKFDLALQMQGNGSIVNPVVELFGARFTAGFCTNKDYCPQGPLFMVYPEGIPEIHRHLLLMEHLGIASAGDDLEFPLTKKDEEDLMSSCLFLAPGEYICIHAGSRGEWRRWPAAYFAQLADHCIEKGWKIVLTGTKEELPVVEEVCSNMTGEPIIAAGKTNLGAMGVLLKNAAGLISNCTGVSHIASALKIKSVVISMDGEPERWAPLNKDLHSTIDWTAKADYNLVRHAVDERFSSAS
jgi:ADP-heptose:LPS heptosyltransferase